MIRVLFVCMGNICRSPMAEAVFQHMVNQAGLSHQILVDSAGTIGYHEGERAHSGTRAVLAKYNIPYDGRARQIIPRDFRNFDYILVMDQDNLVTVKSYQPQDTHPVIRLFLEYATDLDETEVPDPYYTGQFDYVYRTFAWA
jgi:protein-tyrosine phosphatase